MNEAVMFDTHEAFKNFEKAGVAKEHAEVFVEELSKVVVSRSDELATKGELQAGLAEVNAKIDVVEANLRAEIEKSSREVMVRLTTVIAIAVAVIGLMMKLLA